MEKNISDSEQTNEADNDKKVSTQNHPQVVRFNPNVIVSEDPVSNINQTKLRRDLNFNQDQVQVEWVILFTV